VFSVGDIIAIYNQFCAVWDHYIVVSQTEENDFVLQPLDKINIQKLHYNPVKQISSKCKLVSKAS